MLIRSLLQLKTNAFLHGCLIHAFYCYDLPHLSKLAYTVTLREAPSLVCKYCARVKVPVTDEFSCLIIPELITVVKIFMIHAKSGMK